MDLENIRMEMQSLSSPFYCTPNSTITSNSGFSTPDAIANNMVFLRAAIWFRWAATEICIFKVWVLHDKRAFTSIDYPERLGSNQYLTILWFEAGERSVDLYYICKPTRQISDDHKFTHHHLHALRSPDPLWAKVDRQFTKIDQKMDRQFAKVNQNIKSP